MNATRGIWRRPIAAIVVTAAVAGSLLVAERGPAEPVDFRANSIVATNPVAPPVPTVLAIPTYDTPKTPALPNLTAPQVDALEGALEGLPANQREAVEGAIPQLGGPGAASHGGPFSPFICPTLLALAQQPFIGAFIAPYLAAFGCIHISGQ